MSADGSPMRRPHHSSRFPAEFEPAFQARYYANNRSALRLAAGLLVVLTLIYGCRDLFDTHSSIFVARYDGPQVVLYLLVFGLTFVRRFERIWQPVLVGIGWVMAAVTFHELASFFGAMAERLSSLPATPLNLLHGMSQLNAPPPPTGLPEGAPLSPFSAETLFFSLQACILMICLAAFRLQFIWALMLQAGVLCIGVWIMGHDLFASSPALMGGVFRFLQPSVLVMLVVLLASFAQERLARNAFLSNQHLADLQAVEREKRVQTESNLQILGQAIGSIVHDLGNPLTAVQTGAETLQDFVQEGKADEKSVAEFADIIGGGARMLGYLRLSLIEQTRVLEGKPTPVDLKPVAIRPLVETGTRYQKPRLLSGRTITVAGEDATICADEMKIVTVLMNLVGNALKYSDGEVRIVWCKADGNLVIGVLDAGTAGQGISHVQAAQLFKPFGRLATHEDIEGTGLGLLSAQKVIEAHGGEAFIEGYTDGTPTSSPFTTAQDTYPSLLTSECRTAFVVTCTLAQTDFKADVKGVERGSEPNPRPLP